MRINNFIRFSESIKTREDMRVVSVTLRPLISDCTGTIGIYGLFSNEGEPIVLSQVQEEVANHNGVAWTNVVSLRREDAERLGYDSDDG